MGVRSSQSRGPGLNQSDGHLLEYFRQTFGGGGGGVNYVAPPASSGGIQASGGVISEYTDPGPGAIYRSHIFTSTGTFQASLAGDAYPSNVEYLVVAGGGGGGS